MKKESFYNNLLELIGDTPLVKLNRIVEEDMAEILVKLESYNPGGSIKDRIAFSMIEDAEKRGLINSESTIIEPTSGNTGIGIAMICAVKGYKCIIVMPESMSLERIYILKSYGAEVVLTSAFEGMTGSIEKAEELAKKIENSIILRQFDNPANPEIHKKTTALEILKATGGKIDAFVAGIGTGGTISGVGQVLKEYKKDIKIVGIEPATSAVLSGEKAGPHKIPGIGAGFVPSIFNRSVVDEIIKVGDDEAFKTSQKLAKLEGIFAGISSGANVFVALKVAKKLGVGKRVVTVLPDSGERYFSVSQYYNV